MCVCVCLYIREPRDLTPQNPLQFLGVPVCRWPVGSLGMRGVPRNSLETPAGSTSQLRGDLFCLKRSAYGRSYSSWWFQPILKHSQNGNLPN